MEHFDFLVIGAGIAGLSAAAELARTHRVAVVEREAQPGFHATGRSAAIFLPLYGDDVVRALTRASRPLLETPPASFSAVPLLKHRHVMVVASDGDRAMLDAFWDDPRTREHGRRLSGAQARDLVPILRPEWAAEAVLDTTTADVDVHALQEGFLRRLRAEGATLFFECNILNLERSGQDWCIETEQGVLSAPVLINAAGAWADEVADQAGVSKLGLAPCRRTAIRVPAPDGHAIESWPVVGDVGETLYFKPDAGALMISPSDEHVSAPSDAQAEEIDIAIAAYRFEQATTARTSRVLHRWAGLRSFFPDRLPAVGYDRHANGFFWLAGQGGFGIQTAPALAELAAALARGKTIPPHLADLGLDTDKISPSRLDGAMSAPASSNFVSAMDKVVRDDLH